MSVTINDAGDEMTEVKIWHDGDENIMQTIADCANEKLAEDNIKVTFEKKSGLTDQLQLYGNDESNGLNTLFFIKIPPFSGFYRKPFSLFSFFHAICSSC